MNTLFVTALVILGAFGAVTYGRAPTPEAAARRAHQMAGFNMFIVMIFGLSRDWLTAAIAGTCVIVWEITAHRGR